MHHLSLERTEAKEIAALLDELADRHHTVEDPEFHDALPVYAHELPRTVRRFLTTFRLREPSGVCVLSGWPVDQERVGPTPAHWRDRPEVSPALREEMLLALCGSLLGDPVGWATQQDGAFIHDVLPVPGDADEQIGTGSEQTIYWHTEDAFHPYRGDYVGLLCLRNPDGIATTYANVADLDIDGDTAGVLSAPNFYPRPDNAHLSGAASAVAGRSPRAAELIAAARDWIGRLHADPRPVPVLTGAPDTPYLTVDPYFMDIERMTEEAAVALRTLSAEIDGKLREAVLVPGDICFVDNFRAVHGRNRFTARYDGTDRWLKRITVARDLRKSRDARPSPESRIIY